MLAVSVNLATIIIFGLGGASASARGMDVFYKAESGMERVLYRIRQLKVPVPELGMGTDCNCGGLCLPAISGCTVTDAYYSSSSSDVPYLAFVPLAQDQSVQIDLLDTDLTDKNSPGNCSYDNQVGSLSTAACISELRINCKDADGASPLGGLVVTYTKVADPINGWGLTEGLTKQSVFQYSSSPVLYNCPGSSSLTFSFTGSPPGDLNPANSYVVKLRAVKSDVNVNSVKAYDGVVERSLSNSLELTASAGNFLTRQQIKVGLSNQTSAAGLYDYVLYSECGIDKSFPPLHTCPTP